MTFDAVVFDFGMVLSSPPGLFAGLAAALGVEETRVRDHYEPGRHGWDTGGPAVEYWRPMLSRLGLEPTPELIAVAIAEDMAQWLPIRDGARQLLRECRAAGYLVAVLSNAPREYDIAIRQTDWFADIDALFVSGALGMAKPDPEIYAHVAAVLGPRLAFIDDRAPNLPPAEALGWATHLWRSDEDTRAWLIDIGVLR